MSFQASAERVKGGGVTKTVVGKEFQARRAATEKELSPKDLVLTLGVERMEVSVAERSVLDGVYV